MISIRTNKNLAMSKSILTSTLYVTLLTFLIKFLGLVKQSVLAAFCGATDDTDAFFITSGVLLQLCTMIFSAISISLLTVHTQTLVNKGREMSNDLINAVLRYFLPISVLITLIFLIGAPYVARFLAPLYSESQIENLAHYIRLMSCVFVLWCYYLTINVILETDKEFIPGRGQGFFQNIFLIIAAIFLFQSYGMESLIWSFILSGLAECVLVTWCARKRFRIIFNKLKTPRWELNKLLKLSLPLIIGNALYEINDIVDKQISSSLGTGNVSYLTYGSTINEIVTGVIVASVSTVIFAHFATWVSKGEIKKVETNLNYSIELITMIILPIMSLCIFAGDDILRLFYGRGNFGEHEVKMTEAVVIGYASGFIFASARANVVKVFYAFQDTKTPLVNGMISIFLNICCSIIFSRFWGVGGIALATSVAMLVSVVLLMYKLKMYLPDYNALSSYKEYLKGFVSTIACSAVVYFVDLESDLTIIIKMLLECLMCFGTYIICMIALRANCIRIMKTKLFRK